MCDPGQSNERALAVSPDCCCQNPCEAQCCCTDEYGLNGQCLFHVRPPACCTDVNCTALPDDPNLSDNNNWYQGGQTQLVNFKSYVYTGTSVLTLNFPKNDYALTSVYTQNEPSWLSVSLCADVSRYQWNFLPGCTFTIPVCIESYIRDPYCDTQCRDNCDPCNDQTSGCCSSCLDTLTASQFLSTMANYLILHECPGCSINRDGECNFEQTPGICNQYPVTECRLGSGPLMYLFDFPECAGFVEKKCCYTNTGTLPDNKRYYSRVAYVSSVTLVGATMCDGTDNNPAEQYLPTQDTFDCAYITPYGNEYGCT